MFRIQLHNARKGPLIIEEYDPVGILELLQTVKRSREKEGITFEVVLNLQFIKQSRQYLIDVFEQGNGIDEVVDVVIYELDPNARRWAEYARGKVNYNKYIKQEVTLETAIEQTGFQTQLINGLDVDLNLETVVSQNGTGLPAPIIGTETGPSGIPVDIRNPAIHGMVMHSKILQVELSTKPSSAAEYLQLIDDGTSSLISLATPMYGTIDMGNEIKREIEDTFNYGWGFDNYDNRTTGASGRIDSTLYVAKFKYEGKVAIDISLKLKFTLKIGGTPSAYPIAFTIDAYFDHYSPTTHVYTATKFGTWTISVLNNSGEFTSGFQTKVYSTLLDPIGIGDKIYLYTKMKGPSGTGAFYDYIKVEPDLSATYIKFDQGSKYPDSVTKAEMIYESIQTIAQYFTNQVDCFRSNLLGRTDIIAPNGTDPLYPVDGEAGLIALTTGKNIRGIDHEMATNLQRILNFLNAVYCIGYGFKIIDGVQYFIIEKREDFYDKNFKILDLGPVYDIKETLDESLFYNQIEYGFSTKLNTQQVNSLDEFISIRRASIPVSNTKNQLKVATDIRASGTQIEQQRRFLNSTEGSDLDDELFVICVVRDGLTFKAAADEGYDSITNVYDAPSGYNYNLAPARNFHNWFKVLASGLIRSSSKILKFASGTNNYKMTSTKTGESVIAENQSFDLTDVEPLYDNMNYEFICKLTRDQWVKIKANPYGYIEFQDKDNNDLEGFINDKGTTHDGNKNQGTFSLRKVYRKP